MPDKLSSLPKIRTFSRQNPIRIMFVCLGNICRSPTAEGIMQHMVNKKGLGAYYEIGSAGTAAYHEGEPANSKSRNVAEAHGVKLQSRAQKIHPDDFDYYDLILAMDDSNLQELKKTNTFKDAEKKLMLFRAFDPEATKNDLDVPDPYYGGMRGFEDVFEMVSRSCDVLIHHLEKSRN